MHDLVNLLANLAMSVSATREDAKVNGVKAATTHVLIGLGISLVCIALIFVIASIQTR